MKFNTEYFIKDEINEINKLWSVISNKTERALLGKYIIRNEKIHLIDTAKISTNSFNIHVLLLTFQDGGYDRILSNSDIEIFETEKEAEEFLIENKTK